MGNPLEDGHHNVQTRRTCLGGISSVIIDMEVVFQRTDVQIGIPSQTAGELSFVLFSCWHNII